MKEDVVKIGSHNINGYRHSIHNVPLYSLLRPIIPYLTL